MKIKHITPKDIYVIRLDYDEDVLSSLRKAVSELEISNGIIINGTGSIRNYKYHDVGHRELPTFRAYSEGAEPADIISVSGFILGGNVHAHISMGKPGQAYGGHLEEGCRILTFGAIVIMKIDEPLDGLDDVGTSDVFEESR